MLYGQLNIGGMEPVINLYENQLQYKKLALKTQKTQFLFLNCFLKICLKKKIEIFL